MSTLQSTIFIEFDVNTKKITFLRKDNIIDYDSDATSIYVRVKYKDLSNNTVYLTPSELEDYEFSLYTIKPTTKNVNMITGVVTDELKGNVNGGVVKFEIPRACTNRLGIVKCEIHINQGNKKIGSDTFVLDVKQSLVTSFDDELLDDEDFPVLKQLIFEVQKGSNINDATPSETTTYSSNKIEDIKLKLNTQITKNTNDINTLKASGHTHENKSILDSISQDNIDAWNAKPSGGTPTNLTIGVVSTLEAGTNATANITGTAPNLTLNLGIPKGDKGDTGAQGIQGIQGSAGKDAAIPNFTFAINMIASDQTAYVTTAGVYPNLAITFNIPRGTGESTGTDPEPVVEGHIYYGRISAEEAGIPPVIQFNQITAEMIKTAASITIIEPQTLGKTSLGKESTTATGDYCIVAVPTSKGYSVTKDNGIGTKTVFNDQTAGANGEVTLDIDGIQYSIYGELLTAPAEIFIYID